jgi:hypothetical protein
VSQAEDFINVSCELYPNVFFRNQTVEGQAYERNRSRKKRRRAWDAANPGVEYIDGRTRQARDKKQKSNNSTLEAVQQSTQSDPLLDEARPETSNHERAIQADDTILSVQANPTPSLDNAIPFETEFEFDSLVHEAPFPPNPPNSSLNNVPQPSSSKDLRSSVEREKNPLVHPQTTDFAAVVRGIELSEDAPTVCWPGGLTTCVPFIAREDDPSQNVLALVSDSLVQFPLCSVFIQDEAIVRKFADCSLQDPPPFITILKSSALFPDPTLLSRARLGLQKGNTLVLEGYEEAVHYLFSQESIVQERLLDPHHIYSLHGPCVQRKSIFC